MRFRVFLSTAAVLVVALNGRALAQRQLHGVVRDSTLVMPLPGVVISVIDSAGKTTVRTIADAAGKFALAIPPNAARVRAIRIGYHPRDLALPTDGGQPLEFVMSRIPPIL